MSFFGLALIDTPDIIEQTGKNFSVHFRLVQFSSVQINSVIE